MKNVTLTALVCLQALAINAAAQTAAPADWQTGFGVDERVRMENRNNFDLDSAKSDYAEVMYQRLKLNARAELPGKLELFAEGMDLRAAYQNMKRPLQKDNMDLHQAYLAVKGVAGIPLELKVGRQELKYGQGRLIWAATWSNRINHFDAAVLKYKSGGLSADAFYGQRIVYNENAWNDPNNHDTLAGTYVTYRKNKNAPLVEGYVLSNYDNSSSSTLSRNTVGVHGQARLPGALVLDLELPYQFGKSAGKNVYAGAFHADLSREFKSAWGPRIAAIYNYASGDRNPSDSVNNTFIPLYQSTHDPYGLMDLFRWENVKEAALEVSAKPSKGFKLTAGTNFFWLASAKDSWYDSSGKKLRTSAAGTAGTYVGQEASLAAKCDLGGGAGLEGGYARFFAGTYVKNTGTHDNADWLYLQLSVKM